MQDECVLVFSDRHFQAVGCFEGFRPADGDYSRRLLDPRAFQFRPRSEVEHDPAYKQLIPYVMLTHRGSVFHYRRGVKGSESRLRAFRSIGIGGHISEADTSGGDPYATGLQRELDEEVEIVPIVQQQLLGFIYDPGTPVGCVHLGVLHQFELSAPVVSVRDPALVAEGFSPFETLIAKRDEFESWSQIALGVLQK